MILGATREQEQAVRDLMGDAWKQEVWPPLEEGGYVKCRMTGQWSSDSSPATSGWYFVLADGSVQRTQPR